MGIPSLSPTESLANASKGGLREAPQYLLSIRAWGGRACRDSDGPATAVPTGRDWLQPDHAAAPDRDFMKGARGGGLGMGPEQLRPCWTLCPERWGSSSLRSASTPMPSLVVLPAPSDVGVQTSSLLAGDRVCASAHSATSAGTDAHWCWFLEGSRQGLSRLQQGGLSVQRRGPGAALGRCFPKSEGATRTLFLMGTQGGFRWLLAHVRLMEKGGHSAGGRLPRNEAAPGCVPTEAPVRTKPPD